MSSRFRCLFLAVAVSLPLDLLAQDTGARPLTTIDEVLAHDSHTAAAKARPVRVKGIVVAVSSLFNFFHMHDGRHGVAVRYPRKLEAPKQGDMIEVTGETMVNSHEGHRIMRIVAESFTISGTAELPPPESAEWADLTSPAAMDQWMRCEATVADWRFTAPDLLIRLVLRDGAFDAFITLPAGASPPANLFGSRVRLTGVVTFTPALGRVLFVPGAGQLEWLETGRGDPFDAAPTTAAELRQRPEDLPVCQKVRGVVLGHSSENTLHLRDEKHAVRVNLRTLWNNAEKQAAKAAIGDEVEIVGFRIQAHDGTRATDADLAEARVRFLSKGQDPQPVVSSLADLLDGAHTADYVEARGRLLTLQQLPVDGDEWRSTMLIESDGIQMPVALHSRGRVSFDTIKTDDDVLVRGLMEAGTAASPRQIRLLAADAVKSLGLSHVVQARQLWIWAGSIIGVVLFFSGWISALRKSNRVKTEVASLLEKRVNERTVELQKAQTEIARALEHERELGELKSRFVTMVSHEFRTPLGIIMSAIELMRHYNDRLPPEQRGELQNDIFSATRHMAGLMEQVLVLGRVEAGKLGCKTAPCDLEILAGKIVDENLSATNHKCPVIWRAQNDLRGACADEALLRHIFSNLITNAVKYSPAGSEVLFAAGREGRDAVFQVIDRGIGIPENERERLFEAFHRCSNVGETPGTGLGLVIVKRCVDLHGGSMHIDSQTGKGTTFTVRLPLFGDNG